MSTGLAVGLLFTLAACQPDAEIAIPGLSTAATSAPDARPGTPAVLVDPPVAMAEESAAPATPTTAPSPGRLARRATSSVQPTANPAAETGTALALLATLPVKGRSAMTGYDRDAYGQAWADVDRNGCDTRNDVLSRDLTERALKAGTNGCVVLSGALTPDPYTGARIEFVRGGASEVDIDHVVALADSWVTGAAAWDERKRIAFGNDPLNLLAVDSSANRRKGAGDAATWLPRSAYRCAYVARQVAVKAKYELWVKPAERDAMTRVLDSCPGQDAPEALPVELPPAGLGSAAARTPTPSPQPSSNSSSGAGATDPQFAYCTDAKAAGYGPYTQGRDLEYGWYRDADSDGVVCE